MLYRMFLPLILVVLFTGCASTYPHITTQSSPEYASSKYDKVFVFSSDDDGVYQRKLDVMLKEEMKNSGINVVDTIIEADYVIFASLDEKTESGTAYMFLPKTSSASGSVGKTSFSGTETTTEPVPYHYTNTDQIVSLHLHRKSDLLSNKKRTVWEGSLSVRKNDYNQYPHEIIRELLKFFGQDHDATEAVFASH